MPQVTKHRYPVKVQPAAEKKKITYIWTTK